MCNLEKYEQELRLRYSEQTVRSYSSQFKKFCEYFKNRDIRYLSEDEIKVYLLSLQGAYGYSATVHAIAAVSFYYRNVAKRRRLLNLPRPTKPKTLPVVLSFEEVDRMIKATTNLKHQAIIETMFCHGLRRSELINMKIEDIDSSNMVLTIKQSKGLKDRNIPLAESCLTTLRQYYREFKPKDRLFPGQADSPYSATSLRNIIIKAAEKAGVNKRVKTHTLRHSFASYLVSLDVNLIKIQEWLGHSSSKTTEIYCHLQQKQHNPIKM